MRMRWIGSRTVLPLVVSAAFAAGAAVPSAAQANTRQKPTLESLSTQFTFSNWPTVYAAKDALVSLQARAIPVLIALLHRSKYVKLQNTVDLIYTGATEFWRHGGIVNYVDWLSVRAGWALEDLTFQNFGFREEGMKRGRRSRAVSAATAWWARSSGGWNRFTAVVDALKSGDPVRQIEALNWLRNGSTPCAGLSKETFTKSILPEVRRLTASKDSGVKLQADILFRDFQLKEWYWLSLKEPERKR